MQATSRSFVGSCSLPRVYPGGPSLLRTCGSGLALRPPVNANLARLPSLNRSGSLYFSTTASRVQAELFVGSESKRPLAPVSRSHPFDLPQLRASLIRHPLRAPSYNNNSVRPPSSSPLLPSPTAPISAPQQSSIAPQQQDSTQQQTGYSLDSVMRKRKRMMRKHKYRKRLKRERFLLRKLGK
ncbi:hypothetical protein QOT17_023295 [Balamuthia mandrillaris]